jgi:hypothetical protein
VFETSRASVLFDHLRVPSRVVEISDAPDGYVVATWSGSDRSIVWPAADRSSRLRRYDLDAIPIFARTVAAGLPRAFERARWEAIQTVSFRSEPIAHIWRSENGSIFLPFDPDEVVRAFWTEAYMGAGHGVVSDYAGTALRRGYYRIRPVLPRWLQIALRRRLSRLQVRQRFPRWPLETALHDLCNLVLRLLALVAGEPVPWIAPWPRSFTWSLVLTHDVETEAGYRHVDRVAETERAMGYRSAWNFVPLRDYVVEDALVHRLEASGCEVGVHGLHHDGRDLESLEILEARLPQMRDWARRWRATGFRAPATLRRSEWMPLLGFDYDSSFPDTDPFDPQGGGCCSWLPFFNRELVELPITLPQDHTLFVILRHQDPSLWLEKMRLLRGRGGMVLVDTHPDYLLDERIAFAYKCLLEEFAGDPGVWRALPREVTAWWRRRSVTSLERERGDWRATGPGAEEAQISLAFDQAA